MKLGFLMVTRELEPSFSLLGEPAREIAGCCTSKLFRRLTVVCDKGRVSLDQVSSAAQENQLVQRSGKPYGSLLIAAGVCLILLAGCGSHSSSGSASGFGRTASGQTSDLVKVTLTPSSIVGLAPASITVTTAHPAPAAGLTVMLSSSDPAVVATPQSIMIQPGQTSATVTASILSVSAATAVTITASHNGSTAGANLSIFPATPASFSVAIQPATVTVQQGHSGSSKVVTRVAAGYNHALQLKASSKQSGLSARFNPSVIPAPGAGSSQMTVHVQSSVPVGNYPINVTATDGATSAAAKLTLNVTSGSGNANAKFKGCWFKQSGHSYQAVDISVGNPGTYPFNAILYNGATCDANNRADQIGFGQPITFGGFGYTFWFTDFADQTDMSALWYVGDESSQCINYAVAPSC